MARSRAGDQARPGHPQRLEHALAHGLLPRLARDPLDDLAEQAVGEVRVVEGVVGREHLLGLLDAGDEGLAVGRLEALPDVAHRLTLQSRGVGQHLAQRNPACRVPGR